MKLLSLSRYLIFTFYFMVATVLYACSVSNAQGAVPAGGAGRITVLVHGDSLGVVMKTISIQTGYSIAIDERWKDLAVVGEFTSVTPGVFFNRVLRGNNLSIIYDDEKQMMFVRLFGEKETSYYQVFPGDREGGALSEMHGQQNEEFLAQKTDSRFEDMSGMSNAERWDIHRQENAMFARLQNDPAISTDQSGQTNAQRWQQNQQQHEQFLDRKSNPLSVDMAGVSNQVKESLHDKQNRMWEKLNNDPKNIEPLSGKSNAEIREVHKRQSELYVKEKNSWNGM